MSSLLSAELAATCNALGHFDKVQNKYNADSNTLETVKDLIRYLRRDDKSHDIRRQLGETNVLQTDLLPLLKSYWEQADLFDVLLRLLVNLTTPALMLWQEIVPTERTERNYYLQIEDHLSAYKEAFADEAIWAVLSTKISKILELEVMERGDENSLIIERILILIRNILYIPNDPIADQKRPDNDSSIQDQVLWTLHQSGMLDIILYMASSANEQTYYIHIIELLSFMMRQQSASELAKAAVERSEMEKLRDGAELLAVRHMESTRRQAKTRFQTGSRHSRFGGTFVVKSMQAISNNDLIYHKPLNLIDAMDFDGTKQKPRRPKNRVPARNVESERLSAFSIRLLLKEFCVEFLTGAYNTLMYNVKDRLARQKAQQHDESYYLWAIRFFMEFNRCYGFQIKLVSETMSIQTFHFVQQQMEHHSDMIASDKKRLLLWSRRLHLALLAYRELLKTICTMDRQKGPEHANVRDSANLIKSNIFYVVEYRELVLTLLLNYNELHMSPTYLTDLIETQHVFLKMFQEYCSGNSGAAVIQGKSKSKRGNKKTKKMKKAASAPANPNLDSMWDEAAPQLSTILEGDFEIPGDLVPFDATSDIPIDDQRTDAMKNIQKMLRDQEFERGIGLLRAAREVWPENDAFGSNSMSAEEEFLALRDIFLAHLGQDTTPPPDTNLNVTDPSDNDDEEDEEDELQQNLEIMDTTIKFDDFVKRLAHPKIVRACGIALRKFDQNSVLTNHCIVKLMHRIAFDCKMYVLLYQLSIFRTFQRIFEYKSLPKYEEFIKFGTYIIRNFLKTADKNKQVFMESLFWKTSKEAYDVEEGYGSYQEQRASSLAKVWTEQEEDELRRLFMEHQQQNHEEDVVDWIVENLIDGTKNRRMVLKKLKEMYLLSDYKASKKSTKASKQWTEDEENNLRELYDVYKDNADPLGTIMANMEVSRPKNRVIEKMLVLGLIQDRKELRKKRSQKSNRSHDDSNSSGSDSESLSRKKKPKKTVSGQKSRAKPRQKKSVMRQSSSEIAKQLISLVESEHSEGLEWLKESFEDIIEDLERNPDDEAEDVPLVPIMDYSVEAMDNSDFKQLLSLLGVNEPFDEQETYWRIPSTLSATILKEYCDVISKAVDKTLLIVPNEHEDIVTIPGVSNTSVVQPNERLPPTTLDNVDQNNVLSDSDNDNLITPSKPKKKKIVQNLDESSEEEIANQLEFEHDDFSNTNSLKRDDGIKSKMLRIIESSDEETDDNKNIDDETSNEKPFRIMNILDSDEDVSDDKVEDNKRNRSESENDRPKAKRNRIIDSDED